MADLTRWRDLWRRLGVETPAVDTAGQLVINSYTGPERFYHSSQHLDDVLQKLDWAKTALETSGEVSKVSTLEKQRMFDRIELALWYHDVIYDAKRHDNEPKSRELFLKHAQEFGLSEEAQKEVASLIDLTAHHRDAKSLPERILTDCDLAILGAPAAEFAEYDANIRKEYAHVPAPAYKRARKSVLKGFLNQTNIFKTEAFQQKYETPARDNLGKATKPAFPWKPGWFR